MVAEQKFAVTGVYVGREVEEGTGEVVIVGAFLVSRHSRNLS